MRWSYRPVGFQSWDLEIIDYNFLHGPVRCHMKNQMREMWQTSDPPTHDLKSSLEHSCYIFTPTCNKTLSHPIPSHFLSLWLFLLISLQPEYWIDAQSLSKARLFSMLFSTDGQFFFLNTSRDRELTALLGISRSFGGELQLIWKLLLLPQNLFSNIYLSYMYIYA